METRTLQIKLTSARDLNNVNFLMDMDVYAVIKLIGEGNSKPKQKFKSPVDEEGGSNPNWNFTMKFAVDEPAARQNRLTLVFKLRCQRSLGDRDIGEVVVPVKELLEAAGHGGGDSMQHLSYQVRKPSGNPQGVLNFSFGFEDQTVRPPPHAIWPAGPSSLYSTPPPTAEVYPRLPTAEVYPPPPTAEVYPPPPTAEVYPPPSNLYPVLPPKATAPVEPVTAYSVYPPPAPAYGAYAPPPSQPVYGYEHQPPPPPPAYGYPPYPPPTYGYPPPAGGYTAAGYGYYPPAPPQKKKSNMGLGLGAGLAGGLIGGLLIGDLVSDAAAYDGGFGDGGGFDF